MNCTKCHEPIFSDQPYIVYHRNRVEHVNCPRLIPIEEIFNQEKRGEEVVSVRAPLEEQFHKSSGDQKINLLWKLIRQEIRNEPRGPEITD